MRLLPVRYRGRSHDHGYRPGKRVVRRSAPWFSPFELQGDSSVITNAVLGVRA